MGAMAIWIICLSFVGHLPFWAECRLQRPSCTAFGLLRLQGGSSSNPNKNGVVEDVIASSVSMALNPFNDFFLPPILDRIDNSFTTIFQSTLSWIRMLLVRFPKHHQLFGFYNDFESLTPDQQRRVDNILRSPVLSDRIRQQGLEVGLSIDSNLVRRYFNSIDWADTYHGFSIDKAIADTINWRRINNINNIDKASDDSPLDKSRFAYISETSDAQNRPIIRLNMGKTSRKDRANEYLHILMKTVERAEKKSLAFGSHEFVVLVNMSGFKMSRCPPISVIKNGLNMLKMHYPYRLGGIAIVNAGPAFHFLWNIVKPCIPRKALSKTRILSKGAAAKLGFDIET